ncbi:MAG: UPF0280 family protein [Methanomassiliicoccales archaeon]|nr:MAG: UPF0280 family protein [Methanomassiliicoccales archaeon]
MIVRRHFELGETAVTIVAEEELIGHAERSIFDSREELLSFLAKDPFFGLTLEPYEEPRASPPIVKRMCEAARAANVGPMAAVAGAIAEAALEAMVERGADHAIVDNGGDIAMVLRKETAVGIYAGDSPFKGFAYMVPPTDGRYGICTSSGTVGPSISFGIADAATVFAKDVALADACATALGNMVRSPDEDVLSDAVRSISGIRGVDGCVVIVGDRLAMRGKVPDLVRCDETRYKVSERYL